MQGRRSGPERAGLTREPHPSPRTERHVTNTTFASGSHSVPTLGSSGSACASDSLFHSLPQDLLIIDAGSRVARGGALGGVWRGPARCRGWLASRRAGGGIFSSLSPTLLSISAISLCVEREEERPASVDVCGGTWCRREDARSAGAAPVPAPSHAPNSGPSLKQQLWEAGALCHSGLRSEPGERRHRLVSGSP